MPVPNQITVEIINPITTVEVSPVDEINSISVNTVPEVTAVAVDNTDSVTNITIDDNQDNMIVQLSVVDVSSPVQSVNGKTGHVVIDYPDINASPVNHVKYVHSQTTVSNNWEINHNLGFFPNVTILDNDTPPRIVEADIRYLNTNSVTISMNTAMSGTAYLT